ncbi:MAG: hypothetical protein IPK00_19125 [Deltaproteobacteria bacterium]|nr:hypothetical protein [Deltaproteobacteria bacterium]
MSPRERNHPALETCPAGVLAPGPTESASAIEHQAALDATVFRREQEANELVLELEAGELRLRRRAD